MRPSVTQEDTALLRLRKEHGLTRQAVVQETGLGYLSVFHAEHGKYCSLMTVRKLAAYYGVSLDYILRNGQSIRPHTAPPLHTERKPGYVSGLYYHRMKQRMNRHMLAVRSGVTMATISNLEHSDRQENRKTSILLALATVLNVPVDELLTQYPESELEEGDRIPGKMRALNTSSPIDRYRMEKNLSLQQMAKRLGLTSRQGASNVCARPVAQKEYIQRLSEYEGISTTEFMIRYGREPRSASS